MPKRIIDGDAWARSRKIKNGVSEKYRLHYLAWLTLPKPNGTFECDLEQIHADLYSFQLPKIKLKHVKTMFQQFLDAKILTIWQENGKTWGFFPGSEKSGRMVSKEHLKRYKDLPPTYPGLLPDSSGNSPEGFGVGFGVGLDLGLDKGLEDADMSAFKDKIGQLAWENLKVTVQPTDKSFTDLLARARIVGGQDKLVDAFEDFCRDHAGEPIAYPLSMFLKVLDGYVVSGSVQEKYSELDPLIGAMVFLTDGAVLFDHKQKLAIGRLLEKYSQKEIKSAFKEFWDGVSGDEFQVKHAARKFAETAEQLLDLQTRRQTEARKTQEAIVRKTDEERQKAETELKRILAADEAENALIEDTLGS